MKQRKVTSKPGLFGCCVYYDNDGKKVGHSTLRPFGSTIHYDGDGYRVGYSKDGPFGSWLLL